MKKAWEFIKAVWFWYVVRWWWYIKTPKPEIRKSHIEGQTLDDE